MTTDGFAFDDIDTAADEIGWRLVLVPPASPAPALPVGLTSLDHEMRNVLIRLAACSHVPAVNYQPTRSVSSDEALGGKRPPGDHGPAVYARLYGPPFHDPRENTIDGETAAIAKLMNLPVPATDDAGRRRVLALARTELDHLRGHDRADRPRGESLAEFNQRIVDEGSGLTIDQAGFGFHCGPKQIRSARTCCLLKGRRVNIDDGLPLAEAPLHPDERRRRALELQRDGKNVAEICRALHPASRSTIERDLGLRNAA